MKRSRFALLVAVVVALAAVLLPAGVQVSCSDGWRGGFGAPIVRAAGSSVTNDPAGDLTVFSQDCTGMSAVPGNMCLASESGEGLTENITLGYNGTSHCVSLNGTQGAWGRLLVGGLSPALSTTLTLDVGMGRTEDHACVNVFAGGAWLNIRLRNGTPTDDLVITSWYYNTALSYTTSTTEDVGFDNSGRFKITIVSNSVTGTNRIYLNDVLKLTTPFTAYWEDGLFDFYDSFVNPYMSFRFDSVYAGQSAYLQLYSVEQTVPQYSYVTPVSDPKLISFGVDGPHAWNTVDAGLSLPGGGTIWADQTFIDDYSGSDLAALKALLADGWELGIHYSARLSDLPQAVAFELMDNETTWIANAFGQAPTSWCSLQGGDNITHAEYAYTNLGMISRNGFNGSGGGMTNIGNLGDNCWRFWSAASAAGVAIPSFSHELDIAPAIEYSISPDNFTTFVSNYASHGVRIAGFREYWENGQNSYYTDISGVVSDPGLTLSFTVNNIGGRSRLLVNAPWANVVRDGSGASIPFELSGAGIVIEVEDGTYIVAAAPRAAFSADNTAVVVGQPIQFTDLSSGGLSPLAYLWDFGDGTASTLQSPSHSYASAGTFTPVLQLTDAAGSTDIETRTGYITVAEPLGVTTSPPTAVTDNGATLNGNVTSLGTAAAVSVCFEWGSTAAYGSLTTVQSLSAAGAFTAGLAGLSASTTYHFRARVDDGASPVYGADAAFTTASAPDTAAPAISPPSAEATGSGAIITWTTDEAATSQVEYGLTQEYGTTTTRDPGLVTAHSVEVGALEAGQTYHYRVRSADAANNEAASSDAFFTTPEPEEESSGGMPAWTWVLIGLAATGGLGTAAFLLGRRFVKHEGPIGGPGNPADQGPPPSA